VRGKVQQGAEVGVFLRTGGAMSAGCVCGGVVYVVVTPARSPPPIQCHVLHRAVWAVYSLHFLRSQDGRELLVPFVIPTTLSTDG
jgi:hypothetical protein